MLKFVDAEGENNDNWWHNRVREAAESYPAFGFNITQHIGVAFNAPDHRLCGTEPMKSLTWSFHPQWRLPYTVVDVGANVGAFTWLASCFALDVRAYEPSTQTFERLTNNIKQHCTYSDEVQLHNLAVGKTSGETVYLTSHDSGLSGDASTRTEKPTDDSGEAVKTICLEDIIASTDLKRIDYLKVDCEGAEYDFLLGKDLSEVGFMVIELHGNDSEIKKELSEWISRTHTVRPLGENQAAAQKNPTHFHCINLKIVDSYHVVATEGILNALPGCINAIPEIPLSVTRIHNNENLLNTLYFKEAVGGDGNREITTPASTSNNGES